MFHSLPYSEAKRRGEIQNEILEELLKDTDDISKVDMAQADKLIAERL